MPTTRLGSAAPAASAVTGREEVLVASTTSGPHTSRQLREQSVLELHGLRRGLDHQLAVGKLRDVRRGVHALQRQLGVAAGPAAALHALLEAGADRRQSPLECLGKRVVQMRLVAGERGDLGDSGAHRAGADDSDRANRAQPGTSGGRSPSQ